MSRGPEHSEAAWGCFAKEDASGNLRYTGVLHYVSKHGETPCGRDFGRSGASDAGEFVHEYDAPPGTPRCRTCDKRWALW